mmetsp:Transcript_23759/g.30914  ORF Transcript_23759/g.30914 Transcript_23759/m.30914 type:complete len:227 (+) Transcript_23759:57-737(+)
MGLLVQTRIEPVGCSHLFGSRRFIQKKETKTSFDEEEEIMMPQKDFEERKLRFILKRLWYGYDPMLAKDALIFKQKIALSRIAIELSIEGRKRGHWSQLVFPNDQIHPLESFPKTALTIDFVPIYLSELPQEIMNQWQLVLEIIADLMDQESAHNYNNPLNTSGFFEVLPPQDRPRVQRFVYIFQKADQKLRQKLNTTFQQQPKWLHSVIQRLSKHLEKARFDPRA